MKKSIVIFTCLLFAFGFKAHARIVITNCTIAGNTANWNGGGIWGSRLPALTNCILWGNTDSSDANESSQIYVQIRMPYLDYSCVQGLDGGWGGVGNIDADPYFADTSSPDVNQRDVHLKSQAGRWDANSLTWITDTVTSPCIDAGDMATPVGLEPFPNGGRVNMGAFGGTVEASKSYFGVPVCETIIAGDINGDCKVDAGVKSICS